MVRLIFQPSQRLKPQPEQLDGLGTDQTYKGVAPQDFYLQEGLHTGQRSLNAKTAPSACGVKLWHWLELFIAKRTQVSVERVDAPSGQVAWRIYDPRTRRSRYAETSAEVIQWLESNRLTH